MRTKLYLVAVTSLLLAASACGSDSSSSDSTDAGASPASAAPNESAAPDTQGTTATSDATTVDSVADSGEVEKVQIGAALALTGPAAFLGTAAQPAIELALEEINAGGLAGPGRELSIRVEDTASDPTQAVTIVRGFADDGSIIGIIGPNNTPEVLASAPVAQTEGITLLPYAANSAEITPNGPFVFQTANVITTYIEALQPVVESLGVERVGLLVLEDNQAAVDALDRAEEMLDGLGIESVRGGVQAQTTDFSPVITQMRSADVQAVISASPPEGSAAFAIQAKQQGLDVPLLGANPLASQRLIDSGGDAVEGAIVAGDFVPSAAQGIATDFVKNYTDRAGNPPDNYAALAYTATYALATAIANTDDLTRENLRDSLAEIKDLPVVVGDGSFSFSDERRGTFQPVLVTVENGEFLPWKAS